MLNRGSKIYPKIAVHCRWILFLKNCKLQQGVQCKPLYVLCQLVNRKRAFDVNVQLPEAEVRVLKKHSAG